MENLKLAMRTTFKDAGRSINDADKELEALRKSAKAPGLDFPQAVKGSIALQNIGYSAEKSRRIVEQLANTISMSGGDPEALGRVIKQFTQMSAKGRILQEDLGIIVENMPAMSKLMKEAFGTSNAESLREMGITADKFIDTMTKKMEALPRVSGGLANSIVNMGASVQQFLQQIGDDIAQTFDLQSKFDEFGNWLSSVAERFRNLSAGTKEFILWVGATVIALGPMFKVMGAVSGLASQVVTGFSNLGKAVKDMAVSAYEGAKAFQALSLAQKATIIGLGIALIAAAYGAYQMLNTEVNKTAEIMREAGVSTRTLQVAFNNEMETLKKGNLSHEARSGLIKQINERYAEYLPSLISEKDNIDKITAAQNLANKAFEKKILLVGYQKVIESASQRLAEAQQKEIELQEKLTAAQAEWTRAAKAGKEIIYGDDRAQRQAINSLGYLDDAKSAVQSNVAEQAKMTKELERIKAAAEKAGVSLGDLFASPSSSPSGMPDMPKGESTSQKRKLLSVPDLLPPVSDFMTSAQAIATAVGDSIKQSVPQVKASTDEFKNALTSLAETYDIIDNKAAVLGDSFDPVREKIEATKQAIVSMIESGMNPFGTQVDAAKAKLAELESSLDVHKEKWVDFGQSISDTVSTAIGDSLAGLGEGIGKMMAGAINAKGALLLVVTPMLDMLIEVGKLAIKTGLAVLGIKKALESLNPYVAIAGGIALIALASFTKSKLASSVPKMAEGGVVTKPTYLLAGEAGPEMIIPPKKFPGLATMMGYEKRGMGSGGGSHLTGEFTVKGTDLVLVLEKAHQQQYRSFGR